MCYFNYKKENKSDNSIKNKHFITFSQMDCFISNLRPSFMVYIWKNKIKVSQNPGQQKPISWLIYRERILYRFIVKMFRYILQRFVRSRMWLDLTYSMNVQSLLLKLYSENHPDDMTSPQRSECRTVVQF